MVQLAWMAEFGDDLEKRFYDILKDTKFGADILAKHSTVPHRVLAEQLAEGLNRGKIGNMARKLAADTGGDVVGSSALPELCKKAFKNVVLRILSEQGA